MTEKNAIKMINDIVCEIDYDIWKQSFNMATAEEPERVQEATQNLLSIVKRYIEIDL